MKGVDVNKIKVAVPLQLNWNVIQIRVLKERIVCGRKYV